MPGPSYTRISFSTFRSIEKWAWPTFFTPAQGMTDLQQNIQQQLSDLDSELDLVAVERPGNESLRIFIDHPGGVDLALCERVTKHLNHLLVDYSLEVSSPGPKYRRPSTTSETKEPHQ
jgi:ribosome maturation factor RimP